MTEPDSQPPTNQQERFPDRHLFRAFRLAVHFPSILAAAAAVFVLALGLWVIDRLPFGPENPSTAFRWERPLTSSFAPRKHALSRSERRPNAVEPISQDIQTFADLLVWPVSSVVSPVIDLFTIGGSWSDAAYAWTRLLWALAVWAFFAGAISRIAAVKFASGRAVGLRTAFRFSGERFLSYFTAALLPAVGVLFFWLLLLVGGWIGRIPTVGPILVAGFWFLAIAVGLLATLIAIGVVAGWPMMAPTISTEVSDGFDGFSRAFSYVYSRPWQLMRLYLLSALLGMVCVAIVAVVACLVVHMTVWGLSAGMGVDAAVSMTDGSPFALYASDSVAAEDRVSDFAASLARFWLNVAALLVHGFAVSLFWSLMTLTYFAIRNIDDATALDEVFLTETEQTAIGQPEVGISDLDAPLSERPLDKDPGTDESEEHVSQTSEPKA